MRIRDEKRQRVAALAEAEGRSLTNMLDRLLERALGEREPKGRETAASSTPSPDPAEVAASPGRFGDGPRSGGLVLPEASRSPSRLTGGAPKGMCVHRVSLDAFCGRCSA